MPRKGLAGTWTSPRITRKRITERWRRAGTWATVRHAVSPFHAGALAEQLSSRAPSLPARGAAIAGTLRASRLPDMRLVQSQFTPDPSSSHRFTNRRAGKAS